MKRRKRTKAKPPERTYVSAPEDDPCCVYFDPDDEDLEQSPPDVVEELGFDPADEDYDD